MQRKNVAFEQLSDIMAFRILVDNVEQCYHALGVIHSRYPVRAGAVQGLYFDAEAEPVSKPAFRYHRPRAPAH